MKIDNKLNLIVPIYGEDETEKTPKLYVHSSPVEADIWDKYWEPISITFTRIMANHGSIGGPRASNKMLRKVATEMGLWDGPEGVEKGLVAEIHRRTLVLTPQDGKGWVPIPWDEACKSKLLAAADVNEVEEALTFFMLAWLMNRRATRRQMLTVAMELWGAEISSSNCTEFAALLMTSTEAASSGATAAA